jgi:hypothetical protein
MDRLLPVFALSGSLFPLQKKQLLLSKIALVEWELPAQPATVNFIQSCLVQLPYISPVNQASGSLSCLKMGYKMKNKHPCNSLAIKAVGSVLGPSSAFRSHGDLLASWPHTRKIIRGMSCQHASQQLSITVDDLAEVAGESVSSTSA